MHKQIFISEVWWSGGFLIAEIAKMNGYDLGRKTNSSHDNVFAWKNGPFYSMDGNQSPDSLQDILETKWPFDSVSPDDITAFQNCILGARSINKHSHNCCKLPTLSLMTPIVKQAFPDAPIISVVRNGIDVSLYESDNYFLRLLIQDKASRPQTPYEINFVDALGYLFTATGDLRWKIQPTSEFGWNIQSRTTPVLWNLLYGLRWVMINDRLRMDVENHDIKNHHTIRFERIAAEDKYEIEKLQSILKIPGKLKMPSINKSEIFPYRSKVLPIFQAEQPNDNAVKSLRMIYKICKPYLEYFKYSETIELFENLEAIQ